MYLTRLSLDPRSSQARRDLGDAYEMHRTLTRAFAPHAQSKAPRFLWQVEAGADAWSKPKVLVQSLTAADWGVLTSIPNYLSSSGLETKEFDPENLIQSGGRYRFRLLANPVVARDGKRYGLVGEGEQLAWLDRQGNKHGFEVSAALVSTSNLLESRAGKSAICIRQCAFEGALNVTEPHALIRAMSSGIGPAKAFGCGLLLVRRL